MQDCERCEGFYDEGPAVFVITSDVLLIRVGYRCALEAYATTLMLEPVVGAIEIGSVQ
jgi:hypothetical protein